jgi:DNA-binding MarR family transcriptional regulator
MRKDLKLEDVLYYLIDKANKVARQHSQEKLIEAGYDITIDQWVLMKKINDSERITQVALAEALFKDTASIARTLRLLLDKKLVRRESDEDKRANQLTLTDSGQKLIEKALPLVKGLRKKGVEGMSESEIEGVRKGLLKIIQNLS